LFFLGYSAGFLFHHIDSHFALEESFIAFLDMAYKYSPKEINDFVYDPAFAATRLGGMKDDELTHEIASSSSGEYMQYICVYR
jgi:hypothetical protein